MELIEKLEESHKKASTVMHPDIKEILHILKKLIEENAPSPEPAPDPHVVMAEGLPDINIKFRELENKIDKLERDIKLCCPDFDEKARKIQTRFKSNKTRGKTFKLITERYKTKGRIIIASNEEPSELSLLALEGDFKDKLISKRNVREDKKLFLYNTTRYPVYITYKLYKKGKDEPENDKEGNPIHFRMNCYDKVQQDNFLAAARKGKPNHSDCGHGLKEDQWSLRPHYIFHDDERTPNQLFEDRFYKISTTNPYKEPVDENEFHFWYGKSILDEAARPPPIQYEKVYAITDKNTIIIEKDTLLRNNFEIIKENSIIGGEPDFNIYTGEGTRVIFENKEDEIMFKKLYSTRAQLKTKQKKYKRKKKKTRKKKHKKSKKYNK